MERNVHNTIKNIAITQITQKGENTLISFKMWKRTKYLCGGLLLWIHVSPCQFDGLIAFDVLIMGFRGAMGVGDVGDCERRAGGIEPIKSSKGKKRQLWKKKKLIGKRKRKTIKNNVYTSKQLLKYKIFNYPYIISNTKFSRIHFLSWKFVFIHYTPNLMKNIHIYMYVYIICTCTWTFWKCI